MVTTFIEPEKSLTVIENVDVLVVGGGPAGVAAAIGAARTGAKTLLIENLGSFGGMWTNGMVITLAGYNNWLMPYQRCVDGVAGEWLRKATNLNGAEDNRSWVLNSDPEIMKFVAGQMLIESHVLCQLHTKMSNVILEDEKIIGVIVENVRGREVIFAKSVVDCTGNGDVLARSGAPFEMGKQLQPMTMPFFINDVNPSINDLHDKEVVLPIGPESCVLKDPLLTDYASRRHDIHINHERLNKAKENGELPTFGGPWFGGLRKRLVWVNTTRVYGSAVDPYDITRAEMQAREDAHKIHGFYKRELEGFQDSYIAQTSPTIGIRETRRLVGEYVLSGDDIRKNAHFADSIALGTWPIDVHPSSGQTGIHSMFVPKPYQIPFRSLIPLGIDQLIVGGRCISTDREALGSARVGATCSATGQSAGIAAALSVNNSCAIRKLDYDKLKQELIRQSVLLEAE